MVDKMKVRKDCQCGEHAMLLKIAESDERIVYNCNRCGQSLIQYHDEILNIKHKEVSCE